MRCGSGRRRGPSHSGRPNSLDGAFPGLLGVRTGLLWAEASPAPRPADSGGPPTTPTHTRSPSRARCWGRHCSIPELGLDPCRCQWVWAWIPAWALPSWVRGPQSLRLAWCWVVWDPGMRPQCGACLPSPMRLYQRPRFCSRTALHGRPRRSQEADICSFPGPRGGGRRGTLAIHLSCLALPLHVHEDKWPESTSPGHADQLLPPLGTPMPPTQPLCFWAVPRGQDEAVQMEAAVMEARPGPGQSSLRGEGELARRARPCAGGSGLANPGPWTASWPFYRCENQVQAGPGPWCLAKSSVQRLTPNTQDPARPVRSGCWHRHVGWEAQEC